VLIKTKKWNCKIFANNGLFATIEISEVRIEKKMGLKVKSSIRIKANKS
jgi:hypothetical protein